MPQTFPAWDQPTRTASGFRRFPDLGGFIAPLPPQIPLLFDLARMTTNTTGTGPVTLISAVPGFNSFAAAGMTNGVFVRYGIGDPGPNPIAREWGVGGYSVTGPFGPTLTRVLGGSTTGSLLNLSGFAHVFITAVAEDFPRRGSFVLRANSTSTVVNDATCLPTSVINHSPATSDAANDMATTWFVPGTGFFTVNHASNDRLDRKFNYVIT